MAFEEVTCTGCRTPHPSGRFQCSNCEATYSTVGVRSSYNVVEGEWVVKVSATWQHCPLCGEATGLKANRERRRTLSLVVESAPTP